MTLVLCRTNNRIRVLGAGACLTLVRTVTKIPIITNAAIWNIGMRALASSVATVTRTAVTVIRAGRAACKIGMRALAGSVATVTRTAVTIIRTGSPLTHIAVGTIPIHTGI